MMNDETINQFLDEELSEDEVDNYCQMIEEVQYAENRTSTSSRRDRYSWWCRMIDDALHQKDTICLFGQCVEELWSTLSTGGDKESVITMSRRISNATGYTLEITLASLILESLQVNYDWYLENTVTDLSPKSSDSVAELTNGTHSQRQLPRRTSTKYVIEVPDVRSSDVFEWYRDSSDRRWLFQR